MSEKEKPRTNPRAGSNNPELWDIDLDWYFNDFESLCGLQSIGTSGAGENQLTPMSDEEKADRQQRTRNGFLLTMPDHAKADLRTVSPDAADRAAFTAMAHGVFARGRRIWRKVSRLPYATQRLLKQAYEERIPEAGANWGRPLLTDAQVAWLHRQYLDKANEEAYPQLELVLPPPPPPTAWRNPPAVPRYLFDSLEHRSDEEEEEDEEKVLDVVEFMERGVAVIDVFGSDE